MMNLLYNFGNFTKDSLVGLCYSLSQHLLLELRAKFRYDFYEKKKKL